MSQVFIGIDLSGPSNVQNTVVVTFQKDPTRLRRVDALFGPSDGEILAQLRTLTQQSAVAVGIDAPLSYQPGGGDRPGDRDLRQHAIRLGLRAGTVMTPTMQRMVYLTLRGIVLARMLQTLPHPPQIVEVHPALALALHGAPVEAIRSLKTSSESRQCLLAWLETQHLHGVVRPEPTSDHYLAACAAAFAAWNWSHGRARWCFLAQPPAHPFDYTC